MSTRSGEHDAKCSPYGVATLCGVVRDIGGQFSDCQGEHWDATRLGGSSKEIRTSVRIIGPAIRIIGRAVRILGHQPKFWDSALH